MLKCERDAATLAFSLRCLHNAPCSRMPRARGLASCALCRRLRVVPRGRPRRRPRPPLPSFSSSAAPPRAPLSSIALVQPPPDAHAYSSHVLTMRNLPCPDPPSSAFLCLDVRHVRWPSQRYDPLLRMDPVLREVFGATRAHRHTSSFYGDKQLRNLAPPPYGDVTFPLIPPSPPHLSVPNLDVPFLLFRALFSGVMPQTQRAAPPRAPSRPLHLSSLRPSPMLILRT